MSQLIQDIRAERDLLAKQADDFRKYYHQEIARIDKQYRDFVHGKLVSCFKRFPHIELVSWCFHDDPKKKHAYVRAVQTTDDHFLFNTQILEQREIIDFINNVLLELDQSELQQCFKTSFGRRSTLTSTRESTVFQGIN